MILFRDVDIVLPVESLVDGVPVPLPLLIKAATGKSAQDIDREIRGAVHQPVADERDYILSGHTLSEAALRLCYRVPSWIRVLIIKGFIANPFRSKWHSGTVTVTTVNAIGRSSGWILPTRSWHTLFFALGTIAKKPGVVENQVQVRDMPNLTVGFNHDVIGGAPTRRFMQALVRQIEEGTDDLPYRGHAVAGGPQDRVSFGNARAAG